VVEFCTPKALVERLWAMQQKVEDGCLSHGLGEKGGRGLPLFNASLAAGETTFRIVLVKRKGSEQQQKKKPSLLPHERALLASGALRERTHANATARWLFAKSSDPAQEEAAAAAAAQVHPAVAALLPELPVERPYMPACTRTTLERLGMLKAPS